MTKIKSTHLFPNPFQKMSCKLAIQLLSNSVSAAIKTCVATVQLKSNTALHTSEFMSSIICLIRQTANIYMTEIETEDL